MINIDLKLNTFIAFIYDIGVENTEASKKISY